MITRLRSLLFQISILSLNDSKSITLYRNVIEEDDTIIEEEVATLSGTFIIVQVITYSDIIAPNIREQSVFDLEEFPEWIMKRGKELFQRVLTTLESLVQN